MKNHIIGLLLGSPLGLPMSALSAYKAAIIGGYDDAANG
jgi:hypothetical protein